MCFALYEFRERQSSYCATVYLEEFIDFWKHFLVPRLFLPFPSMENWPSFNCIFQWIRQHLTVTGSHPEVLGLQCLRDGSRAVLTAQDLGRHMGKERKCRASRKRHWKGTWKLRKAKCCVTQAFQPCSKETHTIHCGVFCSLGSR